MVSMMILKRSGQRLRTGTECGAAKGSIHCYRMKHSSPIFLVIGRAGLLAAAICLLICLGGCHSNGRGGHTFWAPSWQQITADAIDHPDPDWRAQSYLMLANAYFGGEDAYVRLYRKMGVEDPDAQVRAAAIHALGIHGEPSDVKIFVKLLKDDNPFVRWQATRAMQKIHHMDAIKPLSALVSDENEPDRDVRAATAKALGQYPDYGVYLALISALDDQSYGVVIAATRSLETLTGNLSCGDDGRLWNQWESKQQGQLFAKKQRYFWIAYEAPGQWHDALWVWNWGRAKHLKRDPKGLSEAGKSAMIVGS
jgi:hypothetical protein